MDFLELAKNRYAVRAFSDKMPDDSEIDKILEAAKLAPTAKNNQPQQIYVLKSEEAIAKINSLTPCIYGAPLVFIIAYDENKAAQVPSRGGYNFGELDTGIVGTHMMLEAAALGLGSCWVGMFNDVEVQEAFDLPSNIHVTAILPVGYPAEGCEPADRHTIYRADSEMVEFL